MTIEQVQSLSSKWEMLDALAESLLLPEKFLQINYIEGEGMLTSYVGAEPLKSSRKFSFQDISYVNDDKAVIGLNYPDQLYLLNKASRRFGLPLRQGSLRETLVAVWSRDAPEYKKNVLTPKTNYWVFNREVVRKFGDKYEVSRVIGFDLGEEQQADILLERNGKLLSPPTQGSQTRNPKIKLGPILQESIPNKSGYYSEFSRAIPVNSELGPKTSESKGYFGGIYFDKQGLSVVGSAWSSVDGVLGAGAVGPSGRVVNGVLGVWTDENPKK